MISAKASAGVTPSRAPPDPLIAGRINLTPDAADTVAFWWNTTCCFQAAQLRDLNDES
jgi:hypothetical protein